MPISESVVLYRRTLKSVLVALGITGLSSGLFLWLNQQGLDHSWQQERHEPAPWSHFTSSLWGEGAVIENSLRAQISHLEGGLAPYQDIMSSSMAVTAQNGADDDLDIGGEAPVQVQKPLPQQNHTPSLSHSHKEEEKPGPRQKVQEKPPSMQGHKAAPLPLVEKALKIDRAHNNSTAQQTSLPPPSAAPLPQPVHKEPASSPAQPSEVKQNGATVSHVQKDVGQKHILFIGDSMMQGVAPHAVTALRRHYHIQSYDLSLQSTGLSYPSFFNWPETLRKTLTDKPGITTVVVFLGPNDPWDMPSTARHGHYLKFRSPVWEEDYRGRIRSILDAAKAHDVRVIWIGPPATKRERLSSGILYLDQLFQSEVEQAGQTYISVDKLFHYHNHTYSETMERNGREIRLRSADGTHFTPTGQKVIAEAVMKALWPDLGVPPSP
ncbi:MULTISPECIES: SGNH family hydrolase [unclassified Saccharibacter]|uniref:SGNH/GDSL hydrolase family protein n=1 Tax=unclassified Saccharibacter TaxID=2648722 RepID=UPI001326B139|nr:MULTISPECIES: SGNH family hydrolase [unclassified Saccharibacter]MXV35139.1 DUF459 domain-containing protein [Saccharibacter sp. EH611]MXV57314.1 DUF459 domain-containing protein [Saccharibacter sp. EH70]MXV64825.1 DUF459 domain-containing protein [Saccharibacter sp. EH60]